MSHSKEGQAIVDALNCIKTRDEHLASDLVEIVAGLLQIAGSSLHVTIEKGKPSE